MTSVISRLREALVQVTEQSRMPERFLIGAGNGSLILCREVLALPAHPNRINIEILSQPAGCFQMNINSKYCDSV